VSEIFVVFVPRENPYANSRTGFSFSLRSVIELIDQIKSERSFFLKFEVHLVSNLFTAKSPPSPQGITWLVRVRLLKTQKLLCEPNDPGR